MAVRRRNSYEETPHNTAALFSRLTTFMMRYFLNLRRQRIAERE
jgi:hypothetical protein